MVPSKFAQTFLPLPYPPHQKVVEVAKPPGNKTEASNAEKRIQYLRVNLDPNAAWGVNVVAVIDPIAKLAHGR